MMRRWYPSIKKCLKKCLIGGCVGILGIFVLGVGLINVPAVQVRVSQGVAAWLSHRMEYPVAVDRVRTNGLTYWHVDGIAVPDLAVSVASVRIRYNLARLLVQPHRPLSALTHVVVDHVAVDVTRTGDGFEFSDWIQAVLSQSRDPSRSGNDFRGIVTITGLSGIITDHQGWLKKPLPAAVSRRYNQGSVYVDFRESPRVINVSASVQPATESETAVLVKVNGVWQTRQNYQLTISAQGVAVAVWGPYFFHEPGYTFLGGQAAVTGQVTPRSNGRDGVDFSFDIYAENAAIRLPFFEPEIDTITTRFTVTSDGLRMFPTTGVCLGQAIQVQGTLGFHAQTIDVTVDAESLPIKALETILPAVRLPVSGVGQAAVLRVHGALRQPVVSGQVRLPTIQPLPQAMIRDAVVGYRYHQNQLLVRLLSGISYGGQVSGEAVLGFEPARSAQVSGQFLLVGAPRLGTGTVTLSGDLDRYTATVAIVPNQIQFQGQTLDAIQGVGVIEGQLPIAIPTLSVAINQTGRVYAQGQVSRQGAVALTIQGANVPVWGGTAAIQASLDMAIPDLAADPLAMQATVTVSGEGLVIPDVGKGSVQATVVHDGNRTELTGQLYGLGGDVGVSAVRHNRQVTAAVRMNIAQMPPLVRRLPVALALTERGKTSGAFQVVYSDGDWQASGSQVATGLRIKGVTLDSAEAQWQYSPDAWSVRHAQVRMPDTNFSMDVQHSSAGQTIRILGGSRIRLQRIRPWLNGYGDVLGDCRFEESQFSRTSGPKQEIDWSIQAACDSVMVNSLVVPSLAVAMQKQAHQVTVDRLHIRDQSGSVLVSGQLNTHRRAVDLSAQFRRMAGQRLGQLIQQAQLEFSRLSDWVATQPVAASPIVAPVVGYSGTRLWGGASATAVFESVVAALNAHQVANHTQKNRWDQVSGVVSGELAVGVHSGEWPQVTGDLAIESMRVGVMKANRVRLVLEADADDTVLTATGKDIQVGRAQLKAWQQTARLTPRGIVHFESGYSLDPSGVQHPAMLTGVWPLRAMVLGQDAPVSVHMYLPGTLWGAVSVWVPAVQSVQSDGPIQVTLGGTLARLTSESGSIVFRNTRGQLIVGGDPVPFGVSDGVVSIKHNRLLLDAFGIHWTQAKVKNRVRVSGPIDVQLPGVVGSVSPSIRLAVSIASTDVQLGVPNRFMGRVRIQSGRLMGQYPGRVTVQGDVVVSQATVVPQKSRGSMVVSDSLALDVWVTIGPDVSISGYIVPPTIFTVLSHYVDLSLAAGHPPLRVQGPLSRLSLNNYIQVSDGYVQVANRSFQLMQAKEQDQFFSQNNQIMGQNRITFSGDMDPYVSFRALSLSDVRQQVVSNNVVRDDTQSAMVVVIEGGLQSPHAVWFEHYRVSYPFVPSSLPEFRHKYVLQSTVYDALSDTSANNADIFDVLLSDATPETTSDGSDSVRVEQMGQHRLNAFFNTQVFRPVERLIQERTGLYQVQIDYNPGQAIIQSDESVFVQSGVGMNFIERLTDRMYARVRTDFGVYSDNRPLSEYELSYYLRRNLSINYGQTRRLNVMDDAFVPRLFIKYNYVF